MPENTTAILSEGLVPADEKAEQDVLEQYGIVRETASVYLVGPYRYSKLADAVAEARRMTTTP